MGGRVGVRGTRWGGESRGTVSLSLRSVWEKKPPVSGRGAGCQFSSKSQDPGTGAGAKVPPRGDDRQTATQEQMKLKKVEGQESACVLS